MVGVPRAGVVGSGGRVELVVAEAFLLSYLFRVPEVLKMNPSSASLGQLVCVVYVQES